jgi:hypothetical protein
VKIDHSLEACGTGAIRLVMAGAGVMLIAATLTTNVVSFLLGLVALMACGTLLEENYRRGAYREVAEPARIARRRDRRINPRR